MINIPGDSRPSRTQFTTEETFLLFFAVFYFLLLFSLLRTHTHTRSGGSRGRRENGRARVIDSHEKRKYYSP